MKPLITFILLILVLSFSASKEIYQETDEIILQNADSLIGINLNDASFREFFGNVKFKHRDVSAKCNYAKQYINENRADMQGNVVINQNTMILLSPKVSYFGNTSLAFAYDSVTILDKKTSLVAKSGVYDVKNQIADFTGKVKVEDDSAIIYSNRIIYQRKTRISHAYGNVFVKGKFTDVILTADTVLSIPNENYSIATSNPILFQIDTIITNDPNDDELQIINFDTLTISADTMEAFRSPENEHYKFKGNVEIVRGDISAKCPEAVLFKDRIILERKPTLWYGTTQFYSDSIIIEIPEKKLKKIYGYKNSIMVTMNDSTDNERYNQISGSDIIINIDSSKIKSLESFGEAKSLYFFNDEQGDNGADRKSTDTIRVNFSDGEVDKIHWIGLTTGEFIPENFVFDNPKQFNLPLFKWNEEKPKKKLLK